jgi:hypothetical protein
VIVQQLCADITLLVDQYKCDVMTQVHTLVPTHWDDESHVAPRPACKFLAGEVQHCPLLQLALG